MMTAAKVRNLVLGIDREGGDRLQEHDQTHGDGVACDASQEDGKLLLRCQSLTCGSKYQARRYVDLVPVASPSEDWLWVHKRYPRGMLDGAQRWRQINSDEEGADANSLD